MALCKECRNIFECWHELLENLDNHGFLHHHSIFDLEASATAGCLLCAQWLQGIKQDDAQYQELRERTTTLLQLGSQLEDSYVRAWTFTSFTNLDRDDCWRLSLVFRMPLVTNTSDSSHDSGEFQSHKHGMLNYVECEVDKPDDSKSGDIESEGDDDCDSRFGTDWGDDPKRFKMFHVGVDIVPSQQQGRHNYAFEA